MNTPGTLFLPKPPTTLEKPYKTQIAKVQFSWPFRLKGWDLSSLHHGGGPAHCGLIAGLRSQLDKHEMSRVFAPHFEVGYLGIADAEQACSHRIRVGARRLCCSRRRLGGIVFGKASGAAVLFSSRGHALVVAECGEHRAVARMSLGEILGTVRVEHRLPDAPRNLVAAILKEFTLRGGDTNKARVWFEIPEREVLIRQQSPWYPALADIRHAWPIQVIQVQNGSRITIDGLIEQVARRAGFKHVFVQENRGLALDLSKASDLVLVKNAPAAGYS